MSLNNFETEERFLTDELSARKCYFLHDCINAYIKPIQQKDLISLWYKIGLDHIAEKIVSYLDPNSLHSLEFVCKEWHRIIRERMIWKKLIEKKVQTDSIWRDLARRRGWIKFLFKPRQGEHHPNPDFYKSLFPKMSKEVLCVKNWKNGRYNLQRINCNAVFSKGVYCLQFDDKKIFSGHKDHSIKIWDKKTLKCIKILTGHNGSVLCLQYDDKVLISGSSDATVRVWDIRTGKIIQTLNHYQEPVLHLRFKNGLLVTCSKDWSIGIWNMISREIVFRSNLLGHQAVVNVVDFDEKYIVSGSADKTIRIWNTSTFEFVQVLRGHHHGVTCLQYQNPLLVSGSSDHTIRLWDAESGVCLRILEGHEDLIRCIRFNDQHIVSGAYDGKIKIWDLKAALDLTADSSKLCLQTLKEYSRHVLRIQLDDYQIVTSSLDDTIVIWDFRNLNKETEST